MWVLHIQRLIFFKKLLELYNSCTEVVDVKIIS